MTMASPESAKITEHSRLLDPRSHTQQEKEPPSTPNSTSTDSSNRSTGGEHASNSTTLLKEIGHAIFYILCFLSGQLMMDTRRSQNKSQKHFIAIIQWPITIALVLINVGVLVFDLYLIFKCPFKHCGFVADPNENATHHNSCTVNTVLVQKKVPYYDMQKVILTMTILSGTLSYVFMIKALLRHYKTWSWRSEERNVIVNPFLDEPSTPTESYIAVSLKGKQLSYFYLMLLLNLALFLANSGVLFYLVHIQDTKSLSNKSQLSDSVKRILIIDYFETVAMRISQYSAIISCFIFSKVAYAMMLQCNEMLEDYKRQNTIKDLENRDLYYVNLNKHSMKPYRLWFTLHWILYTVSAFISIAYLTETIIQRIYGHLCHCDRECKIFILYVFLLALEHVFLFLYPCFRAASILEARKKLIKDVSKDLNQPDHTIKYHFLDFMKKQRFGFVLSIFCARIEFGFNLAYLSLFIGLLAVIIKLCV